MDLIDKLKHAPTEAETLQWFETTMRDALRFGLTSIHDAVSFPNDIAFFRRHVCISTLTRHTLTVTLHWMADEGRLPVSLNYINGALHLS